MDAATQHRESLAAAAAAIGAADALVIAAGAGMGVDSGLPDFRGNEGFWRAYPPLAKLGLSFAQMANPEWFDRDPALAWGFYGHRLQLYRRTAPHAGFAILRRWAEAKRHGAFVFTSNVDGHFTAAGFGEDRVVECHGSLRHLQCVRPCAEEIWPVPAELALEIDPATFRAQGPLPRCPQCGALARPNVLMFGDCDWLPARTEAQERRFSAWLETTAADRITVIELGAGRAVPTVRMTGEHLRAQRGGTLVRINPREPEGPYGTIPLPLGALDALQALDGEMGGAAAH